MSTDPASVHLAACTPNFLALESTHDRSWQWELLDAPLEIVDGYVRLPTRPGLGIDLNYDAFEKYPFKRWTRAFPIREDGSMGYP